MSTKRSSVHTLASLHEVSIFVPPSLFSSFHSTAEVSYVLRSGVDSCDCWGSGFRTDAERGSLTDKEASVFEKLALTGTANEVRTDNADGFVFLEDDFDLQTLRGHLSEGNRAPRIVSSVNFLHSLPLFTYPVAQSCSCRKSADYISKALPELHKSYFATEVRYV